MADAVERLWAVVPAGGAGTRLWPLSRADSPKFLHDLTGSGRTLLQATVDRLLPLVGERPFVESVGDGGEELGVPITFAHNHPFVKHPVEDV